MMRSGYDILMDTLRLLYDALREDMLICNGLVTLSLSDEDFGKLVDGKANAQRLFMGGKLKVKGDVMKATKLEPVLAAAKKNPKAKL